MKRCISSEIFLIGFEIKCKSVLVLSTTVEGLNRESGVPLAKRIIEEEDVLIVVPV